ncbi:MAG: nickel-dependent lactate racemase [Desulfomonilaceae bacterium]
MSQFIEIPWGDESLSISLPKRWTVLGELKPKPLLNGKSNPVDACAKALNQPIGAERLGSRKLEGKKILIVVDDHSRPTPVADFLPAILHELALGKASIEDIQFLLATGVHRQSRPNEVIKKLGESVLANYHWTCHDSYDLANLVDLGHTSRGTKVLLNRKLLEADLIVCVGAIEPHLLLGFGGGLKMIIPGCAGAETIGMNHMQGVGPEHFNYVGISGDHSPMRRDLEEGASLLRRDIFIVNAVMDERAQVVRFFCGDPVRAHRAGESFVENAVRLDVHEQADVVITNSFPMDTDLRQSAKCIGNTLYGSKPGGIMMGFARSINGLGEMPLAKKSLPYSVIRATLRIIGRKRILPLVRKVKKGEPVEELFIGNFGLQMLRRNHICVFSDCTALPPDFGRKMGIARSFSDIRAMVDWAASKTTRSASVWVFPYGGASYVPVQKS